MNRFLKKQKGFLIMVIGLTLFIIGIEAAFLTLFNDTLYRVNHVKRKVAAENLSDIGLIYLHKMEKEHNEKSPEKIFPRGTLKIEKDKKDVKYSYVSPPLIKDGFFSLDYYYSEGKLIKLICTGYFEGITSSVVEDKI